MAAAAATAALGSCITNDLPYPDIQANFTSFMVEDMAGQAQIDTVRRTVVLPMAEQADLEHITVLSYELAPSQAAIAQGSSIPTELNLTSPYQVLLTVYRTYEWTISATQTIERHFSVAGQIGASTIDVEARRVIATVPASANLEAISVTSMKLGAISATQEPDLNGLTVNFTRPVEVTVTDHGQTQTWHIYVVKSTDTVALTSVDAWTRVAWLYGAAEAGKDNGFQYRLKGDTEWTDVPADWITTSGGTMTARLVHLSPQSTYEARAKSGADTSEAREFTTGTEAQMPNSDFELWHQNGRVWNPWPEGGESYWDTGNRGATTLGPSNSVPSTATMSGTGYCAELLSKFVGIGPLGKLASGNIFTGSYVRTDGTNGILAFGRPFTERPTRLTGYVSYAGVDITQVGSDEQFRDWKGRPDTAQIYIALTTWEEPFEVRTNPRNRQLFNPSDPAVVAYGCMEYTGSTSGWIPMDVKLNYRTTSVRPTRILVVAAASKWGDYFVGGDGSLLYIDDFKLEYDD